jgi:lipoate-protein ligase A
MNELITDATRNTQYATRNTQYATRNTSWRLLRHGSATGAENMAIDEAIGRAVAARVAPPTLRFYAWEPPCVSVGRHQSLMTVDTICCAVRGYQVVRRPTGGRAILHTDELTYSIVAPPDHPLMEGLVLDSYLRLSHGLVDGLRRLGIAAEEAPGSHRAGPDVSAACFEVPSAYEIVAAGRKLLGSAQARRSDYVLQHGSLPLTGDLTRVVECLALPSEAEREALRRSLAAHATTVETLTGRQVTLQEAADALGAGFAAALDIELIPGDLTPTERAWVAELVTEKYGNPDWTERM